MPMINLIESSDNHSKISKSLWQYCKDEVDLNNKNDILDLIGANNTDWFNFQVNKTGRTGNDGTKNIGIPIQLKHLSNFWRTFEILFN